MIPYSKLVFAAVSRDRDALTFFHFVCSSIMNDLVRSVKNGRFIKSLKKIFHSVEKRYKIVHSLKRR